MADTIRTKTDILNLLPVNVTGDIGAQDIRDAVVSIYSGREANVVYERNAVEQGADPTGVADSTAAIQAAIQAVYSNVNNRSGTVLIPQGTYKVSLLTLLPGVSLVGMSPHSVKLVPYNATGTGLIEYSGAPHSHNNLRNLVIDGAGATGTPPQWGIYVKAALNSSLNGGWWDSDVTDVDIVNLDNGIWLQGGETGSALPNQYVNLTRVYIERNAGVAGINIKLSGQTNQMQIDSCILTATSSSNRMGTGIWLGSDVPGTSGFRYPQGIESTMLTINSCQTACRIHNVQGFNFKNTDISGAYYGFDVSGVLSSGASEVVAITNPRFAANVGSASEVADGFLIKAGANSKVRATDVWYSAGDCATPFVNASSRGLCIECATNCAEPEGFNALTSGMTPTVAITGSGTAGIIDVAGHGTVKITGSAVSVSTINSQLLPGESITGIVAGASLLLNTTNGTKNIRLPRGMSSCTVGVDRAITITRLDGLSGVDYFISFTPVAAAVAALSLSATLTDVGNKMNEILLALQNGKVMV